MILQTRQNKRLYTLCEAADYLGVSQEFLRKARQGKTKIKGPPYRKIGERIVIYTIEDLDAYIDETAINKDHE